MGLAGQTRYVVTAVLIWLGFLIKWCTCMLCVTGWWGLTLSQGDGGGGMVSDDVMYTDDGSVWEARIDIQKQTNYPLVLSGAKGLVCQLVTVLYSSP